MSNNLGDIIDLSSNPNLIAIVDQNNQVTYKQLSNLINLTAHRLKSFGINPGDNISIKTTNSIEFVVLHLAVLKLGAISVLINANLPAGEVDRIRFASKSVMILTSLRDLNVDLTQCNTECDFAVVDVDLNDPAVILYTSGTTGLAKSVVLPHRRKQIMQQRIQKINANKSRKILSGAAFYHNAGLGRLEYALISHSTLIVMSRFDPKLFIQFIEKHQPTDIFVVPAMLSMLLKEHELISGTDITSVETIVVTGAAFQISLLEKVKQLFPKAKIVNTYGTTELGNGLFGKHPTLPTPDLSVGYPLPWNQYRIVDGVLEMQTPTMLLDCNKDTQKNITQDGYFVTNDIFHVDQNGFYYFLGRADNMFTCGGHNIYPEHIESVLESHHAVEMSCVVGAKDDVKEHKPFAFVTVKESVTETELLEHCQKILPRSHCPRKIWIMPDLPMNGGGKVDRVLLKQHAQQHI